MVIHRWQHYEAHQDNAGACSTEDEVIGRREW